MEVGLRVDDLVGPLVDEEPGLLHLDSELTHHDRGLCLVLVGLNLAFVLLGMVVCRLVCLCERMVERLARAIIAETAQVGFLPLGFLHFNSHDFYL